MSNNDQQKEQALELLQGIPDDKVAHVIEILKGLQALYAQNQNMESAVHHETPDDVLGVCSKYANPNLIPLEKTAWGEVAKEKHAAH